MKPRTSTRAKVWALAARMGVKVFDISGPETVGIELEAPHRKLFKCNDCHGITAVVYRGKDAAAEVYGMAIEDLEAGLYDCDDPDCEWCNGGPELEDEDEDGEEEDNLDPR